MVLPIGVDGKLYKPLKIPMDKEVFSIRRGLKNWAVPLFITAISVVLALVDGEAQDIFPYNLSAIQDGQIWRFLSGHFIHLGWSHFALNISGLLAVWFVFGRYMPAKIWILAFISLALAISSAFYLRNPELVQYVGLSGVLYGVLVIVLINILIGADRARHARFFYYGSIVILLYVFGRILYEQIYGQIAFSTKATGGNVIVDAHLYGVISGIIFSAFLLFIRNAKS